MTYMVNGKQFISIAVGGVGIELVSLSLPPALTQRADSCYLFQAVRVGPLAMAGYELRQAGREQRY